jgi:hypothetical protein
MDERSQKRLKEILKKDINDLIDSDKSFLKARQLYLTRDQLGKYINVLTPPDDKRQKMLDNLAKARAARKLNKA